MANNLEDIGVNLVAQNEEAFSRSLDDAGKSVDHFQSGVQYAAKGIDAFGEIAIGALRKVGELGVEAFLDLSNAVQSFTQDAINSALESEVAFARIQSLLISTGQAAEEQQSAWNDAQGKTIESTKLSAEKQEELKQKLDDLGFSIRKEEADLGKLEKAKDRDNIAIEGQIRQIEKLKKQYEITSKELVEGSGKISTSLVDALNLIPPAARLSMGEIQKLGKQFANLAEGSDDKIYAIIESGLKLGTITKDNAEQYVTTVLDVSQVMGSVESASFLMSTAIEDPVAAMGRAKRAGIIFSDQLKEQVKQLDKQGKKSEATALVMNRFSQATKGMAQAVADTTQGKINILKGQLSEIGEDMGAKIIPIFSKFIDKVIMPAIPTFEIIIGKVGEFIDKFSSSKELETFIDNVTNLSTKVQSIILILMTASSTEDLMAKLGIDPSVLSSLQPIGDALQKLFDSITASMPMVLFYLQEMGQDAQEAFNRMSPEVIANIATAISTLADIWTKHGATIMAVIEVAWRFVVATITGAALLVTTLVANFTTGISGLMDTVSLLMQGKWEEAWQRILLTVSLIGLNILNAFFLFMEQVLSIAGTNLEEFQNTWFSVFKMIQIIMDYIENTIRNKLNEIIGNVRGRFLEMLATIRSFYQSFIDAGAYLVQGIINGINSKVGGMISALETMVGSAIDAAKRLAGIYSPSSVARFEIGQPLGEGMALGIMDTYGIVSKAMRSVVGGAVSTPATGNQYNSSNSTSNYNFQMSANYANTQSPVTVSQDVSALLAFARM